MEDHWNTFTSDMEVQILKNYTAISQKFTTYYSREYPSTSKMHVKHISNSLKSIVYRFSAILIVIASRIIA